MHVCAHVHVQYVAVNVCIGYYYNYVHVGSAMLLLHSVPRATHTVNVLAAQIGARNIINLFDLMAHAHQEIY